MPAKMRAASAYTVTELTSIYNQSRSDYLVPMQMTPEAMSAYLQRSDVDLDASCVAFDDSGETAGIGMLGLRHDRAWVTRFGVMPEHRGQQTGRRIMQWLIDAAISRRVRRIQLEVIVGNDPAYRLFTSLGFTEMRRLVVVRRPKEKKLSFSDPLLDLRRLTEAEIASFLASATSTASWVGEARSILHSGGLIGFRLGGFGPLVCRAVDGQIEHVVMSAEDESDALFLLFHLHTYYADFNATVENVPDDSPLLAAYERAGYTVAFRRIEMALALPS